MTGLDRRLRLLEVSSPDACEECGLGAGAPFVGCEVEWFDEEGADLRPEWCAVCGEQTTFVVGWRDLPDEDPGEGAS